MSHPYWIWLPQICSCNQNSQWYSICRKPCLFYPFSPLIVLGHHQLAPRFLVLWNVWNMHQVHLLEFLNMAASDCSCDQNSQRYSICRKPCLSYPFCLDSSLWMQQRLLLLLSSQPQRCMVVFNSLSTGPMKKFLSKWSVLVTVPRKSAMQLSR